MVVSRRTVLLGTFAFGLVGGRAASAAAELEFNELYTSETVLADKPKALSGGEVVMTGYMAPPLKAEASFFVLTSTPLATCPFCETEMQWPDDIVLVLTAEPIEVVAFNRPIRVTGRLETGFAKDPETGFVSLIRLRDAEFERAN